MVGAPLVGTVIEAPVVAICVTAIVGGITLIIAGYLIDNNNDKGAL